MGFGPFLDCIALKCQDSQRVSPTHSISINVPQPLRGRYYLQKFPFLKFFLYYFDEFVIVNFVNKLSLTLASYKSSTLKMIKVIWYHGTEWSIKDDTVLVYTACWYITVSVFLLRQRIRSTFPNPAKAVHMGMITCTKPWHPELFKSLCSKESDKQRGRHRKRQTIKQSDLIQQMWQDCLMSGGSCYCIDCLNDASTKLNVFSPCCFRLVIRRGTHAPQCRHEIQSV